LEHTNGVRTRGLVLFGTPYPNQQSFQRARELLQQQLQEKLQEEPIA